MVITKTLQVVKVCLALKSIKESTFSTEHTPLDVMTCSSLSLNSQFLTKSSADCRPDMSQPPSPTILHDPPPETMRRNCTASTRTTVHDTINVVTTCTPLQTSSRPFGRCTNKYQLGSIKYQLGTIKYQLRRDQWCTTAFEAEHDLVPPVGPEHPAV